MKKFTFLFIILCGFIANQSFAQFTGKIQFNSYDVEAGHKQKDNDGSATLYITPERIFVQSSEDVDLGGNMGAKGILIRNDKNDILIFKGNNKAMKLSKSSIMAFMGMAAGLDAHDNNGDDKSDVSIKKTGKTKTIDGYKSDQFIVRDKSEPNEHMMIWMTNSIDINWGFLTDIVKQANDSFGNAGKIITNALIKKGISRSWGKSMKTINLIRSLKLI